MASNEQCDLIPDLVFRAATLRDNAIVKINKRHQKKTEEICNIHVTDPFARTLAIAKLAQQSERRTDTINATFKMHIEQIELEFSKTDSCELCQELYMLWCKYFGRCDAEGFTPDAVEELRELSEIARSYHAGVK